VIYDSNRDVIFPLVFGAIMGLALTAGVLLFCMAIQ
jgi:hypothetical protein